MTRATLSEIWSQLDHPFWKAVREEPIPPLERVEVSIRPLRAELWAPCSDCLKSVTDCECDK